jgi:hypothetical protein
MCTNCRTIYNIRRKKLDINNFICKKKLSEVCSNIKYKQHSMCTNCMKIYTYQYNQKYKKKKLVECNVIKIDGNFFMATLG